MVGLVLIKPSLMQWLWWLEWYKNQWSIRWYLYVIQTSNASCLLNDYLGSLRLYHLVFFRNIQPLKLGLTWMYRLMKLLPITLKALSIEPYEDGKNGGEALWFLDEGRPTEEWKFQPPSCISPLKALPTKTTPPFLALSSHHYSKKPRNHIQHLHGT